MAVELAPSLFIFFSPVSFQSWKTRLTFAEFQSRLPVIQASYSAAVRVVEPMVESQNWMPTPSLLPRAKHLEPALAMAAQSATNLSHVVAGLAGSRFAFW